MNGSDNKSAISYLIVILVIIGLIGSWMAYATGPGLTQDELDESLEASEGRLVDAITEAIAEPVEEVTRADVIDFLMGHEWDDVESLLDDANIEIPEVEEVDAWEREEPEDIEPFDVPEAGIDWLPGPDLAPETDLGTTTEAGRWKTDPPWTFAWASYGGGNSWSIQHRMIFRKWTDLLEDGGLIDEVIIEIPYFDPDEQLSQLEALYERRDEIDALFVTPLMPELIQGILEDFYDAGVPVIILNAPYNVETNKFTQAHIYDDRMSGFMMARWLVKELGEDGLEDEQILNIRGPVGTSVDLARHESAMYVFDQYEEIEVVAEEAGDFAYEPGYEAAESMLAAHPDADGIFSQSGMSTTGAIDAMIDMGLDFRPITGEDHNGQLKRQIDYRDEGLSTCFVPKQVTIAGKGVMDAAMLLRGMSVERVRWYAPMHIPAEQADEFVLWDLPDAVWPHSLLGGTTEEELAEEFGDW